MIEYKGILAIISASRNMDEKCRGKQLHKYKGKGL
jgi:hypothetical protein